MKKSERHQIKRDDLVTVIERGSYYIESHSRRLAIAGVVLVVLAAASLGARTWWRGREEKASLLLGQIMEAYKAPVTSSMEALQQVTPGSKTFSSAAEKNQEVVTKADEVLSRFGSSRLAPKALYYKGLALAELKKTGDAEKAMQDLLARYPGDFLAGMARFELAHLKEMQGNPSEALIQYQALAEDTQGYFPREEGLMGVGRCQEALGRTSEALKTYRKIVSDFPGSEYQAEAKKKVEELS